MGEPANEKSDVLRKPDEPKKVHVRKEMDVWALSRKGLNVRFPNICTFVINSVPNGLLVDPFGLQMLIG